MTSVNRVDHALLLLKDGLRRLRERSSAGAAPAQARGRAEPLAELRRLARRRAAGRLAIDEANLRRALVGALLADALGENMVGSLEFQALVGDVARALEDSDSGRELLIAALAELA